ncbi:hypothetical protein [Rhodococcus sp. NPDC060176]|uniref:hypothetical protein n=1 Tax=Rhodococcus sp. NPDC060176 TaxID=3347062 RepID=UPI003658A7BD
MDREAVYQLGLLQHPPLESMVKRVKRGGELASWGLNAFEAPDSGSSMALDDDSAFREIPPKGVIGAVCGPVMWATDNLASLEILVDQVSHTYPFKHHAASFMSLCRSAFECSAQTIWILAPEARDKRRSRAAGMSVNNLGAAKRYFDSDFTLATAAGRAGSRVESDEVAGWITGLRKLEPESANYSKMVKVAAAWIEASEPPHLSEEFGEKPVAELIEQQYTLCSSFTHGHTWPALIAAGKPSAMFAMMADSAAVAVYVTECAIALFEAQASKSGGSRTRHYPPRLQSTIEKWATPYST